MVKPYKAENHSKRLWSLVLEIHILKGTKDHYGQGLWT